VPGRRPCRLGLSADSATRRRLTSAAPLSAQHAATFSFEQLAHLQIIGRQFHGLSHLVAATDVRLCWSWFQLWRAAVGAPLRLRSLEVASMRSWCATAGFR
jgi:hypothetical protein